MNKKLVERFTAVLLMISGLLWAGDLPAKSIRIYVSVNGSDSNNGSTAGSAMQTIQAAIDKAQSLSLDKQDAVTILLQQGVYYISKPIVISKSLPGGASLTITSEGGEVRISGFRRIERNKIKTGGQYWEIDVSGESSFVSQLKVNERIAPQSVYPDNDWLYFKGVTQKLLKQRKNVNLLSDSAVQTLSVDDNVTKPLKGQYSNLAEIQILNKWHFIRRPVNNVSNAQLSVVGQEMVPYSPWKTGTRYQIVNSTMGMSAGRWMYDKVAHKIYYKPAPDETAGSTAFYIPVTDELLLVRGSGANSLVSNVYISNVTFEGAGFDVSDKGLQPQQAASTYGAAIEVGYARNIQFLNCAFTAISENVLWLNECVYNSLIDGCYFNEFGMGAIRIGEPKPNGNGVKLPVTAFNTVSDCIIQNGGKLNAAGAGIAVFQSHDNKIINNEVSDLYYTGVTVGWTWGKGKSYATGNLIAGNIIHHIGKGVLDDLGGIYMLGNSSGTVIRDNIIHHIYSYDYGGWGIYLDQGSANIKVTGNLVVNTKSGGYFQSILSDNIEVANNIFANADINQLQLAVVTAPVPDTFLSFHDNIIVRKTGKWFYGSWGAKIILFNNNTFYSDARAPEDNSVYVKRYSSPEYRSKFIKVPDLSIFDKDNYVMADISQMMGVLNIKRSFAAGTKDNKWSGKTNSRNGSYYSRFNERMRKTTLFRENQVGL
ncbi:right-handed parallel beta-helix repeat-containing protein [Chitinophaga agri]|uniref:Right-handed parallel beta-helix repeat-containing protein n=1 Tax=Chitinophaga agri TaxID=2703787 RepID=A0A6B9Z8P2_9BACT|nr:right-handed parallel beta-helix repeat-containing protein [Chitinophaga agri]QHS58239.1 right-handed parallel beta-helix repeat-containing protein [Chitinophaga agri]